MQTEEFSYGEKSRIEKKTFEDETKATKERFVLEIQRLQQQFDAGNQKSGEMLAKKVQEQARFLSGLRGDN